MSNESKFTIHIDASALDEKFAEVKAHIENVAEQIGLVADKLESGIAASRLGVPDAIHVIGMRGVMTEAAQQLRALLGPPPEPESAARDCPKCGTELPPGAYCKGIDCPLNPAQAKASK